MIEELYRKICDGEDLRKNLITMRQEVKEEPNLRRLREQMSGDCTMFLKLLEHEDPKVRKNAVLILGELGEQQAASAMMDVYEKEETLFVRSDYLTALGNLDYSEFLERLEARNRELLTFQGEETSLKHIHEELNKLQKLLVAYKGLSHHTFTGLQTERDVILTIQQGFGKVLAEKLKRYRRALTPLGVKIKTKNPGDLFEIRIFDDFLFPFSNNTRLDRNPEQIARAIVDEKIPEFLAQTHEGEDVFFFRIGLKSKMDLREKSAFAKKTAIAIEKATEGRLKNSTSGYEVEIQLLENKDGSLYPCLKLYTIKDPRFKYRKNTVATSIRPQQAALMMELAKPYFKEKAQVLDPFCGTGTMLIERAMCKKVYNAYGIDIFGEAIQGARKNTEKLFPDFHYIQRDFFDFTHAHLFDEIVTNMPVRGKGAKENLDELYAKFFDRATQLLTSDGVIVMYSGEEGFVKKQLRIHSEYQLMEEHVINKKLGTVLFIIGMRG